MTLLTQGSWLHLEKTLSMLPNIQMIQLVSIRFSVPEKRDKSVRHNMNNMYALHLRRIKNLWDLTSNP